MWEDISKEEKEQAIVAFEKRQKQKYTVGKWIFIGTVAVQVVLFLLLVILFRLWEDLSLKNILKGIIYLAIITIAILSGFVRDRELWYWQRCSHRTGLGLVWAGKALACFLLLLVPWFLETTQVVFFVVSIALDTITAILYFKSQALKTFFYDRFEDF